MTSAPRCCSLHPCHSGFWPSQPRTQPCDPVLPVGLLTQPAVLSSGYVTDRDLAFATFGATCCLPPSNNKGLTVSPAVQKANTKQDLCATLFCLEAKYKVICLSEGLSTDLTTRDRNQTSLIQWDQGCSATVPLGATKFLAGGQLSWWWDDELFHGLCLGHPSVSSGDMVVQHVPNCAKCLLGEQNHSAEPHELEGQSSSFQPVIQLNCSTAIWFSINY